MALDLLSIDIRVENDVVLARQKARAIAASLKFDAQDQTRIATAVSEIARNTFQYGGGGAAEFRVEEKPERMLVIALRDQGKGIGNLDEIMNGKYVSRTGMGQGMIGAKRLMDRFYIETGAGNGTRVVLGKKIPRRLGRIDPKELKQTLSRPENASPYEELKQQNKELINAMQELRARQEELAQLNRELDETNRGVVALYAELNEKADFLQRASELKSHFLSNMSHEFRTPLNSIIGLSQILLDRLDGELSPEQEKQVKFIHGSAQGLVELVNDLLDLAKVEAGKVAIHPNTFSVDSLFAALRGMLRPLLNQNSSVNLVFEDPVGLPEMYTDEAKVSQILRNFISNALKFTDRGEVRVSATRGHGDTVVFSVADTGIGIAEEDQERIFQEWAQVEGKKQRTVKGSGLGLPLSRKFAQMLGGDVYVRSRLSEGSTFFASIPVHFAGETESFYTLELEEPENAGGVPLLVVEDNREELFIYERILKGTQFQIVAARTLKEARKMLQTMRPAAIILDVLLRGEHSWELLQELKRDAGTANIPILVVTIVDNRDKALALGADAFHTKPIDRVWLAEQLNALLVSRPQARRLLLIDDDAASRYLFKSALGRADFRISEASGGSEGLRKAGEEDPDIVVLDLGMPDLSGFEVLAKLKENPRTAAIPVIIHTAKVLDDRERDVLHDAAAIVLKDNSSRETLRDNLAQAFHDAGFPIELAPVKEA
jgi:signal transduction histidine kinase/CheY-like chemotaxis protein/anti-sigma regulatory factor (Ser/Thr protein kinase)